MGHLHLTEHPTREGKAYCAVVLDVFSRRVVGWSIDSSQNVALVTNALGMAIAQRAPTGETANAIFEYLEIFPNRQRRHSALGMLTPIEFEARPQPTTAA